MLPSGMKCAALLLVALVSCGGLPPSADPPSAGTTSTGTTSPAIEASIDDFGWLVGDWSVCSGGRVTSEIWRRLEGRREGEGTSITGASMTRERMRIQRGPAGWRFHAEPDGQPPASFRLVALSEGRAVFENPAHDYPQRISYQRTGDRLAARIETLDGSKSTKWDFVNAPAGACVMPP